MIREIFYTDDGSASLSDTYFGDTFHSGQGAIAESKYVYILNGLNYIKSENDINILEFGFGTGLNLLLSYIENINKTKKIYYETLEKFPLEFSLVGKLNYSQILNIDTKIFEKIHNSQWNTEIILSDNFIFNKKFTDFSDFEPLRKFDIVFFDAFSPDKQPEVWSEEIFRKIFNAMNKNAILVTYSVNGKVKQMLRNCGFEVFRIKGFAKKRHMLRAVKN